MGQSFVELPGTTPYQWHLGETLKTSPQCKQRPVALAFYYVLAKMHSLSSARCSEPLEQATKYKKKHHAKCDMKQQCQQWLKRAQLLEHIISFFAGCMEQQKLIMKWPVLAWMMPKDVLTMYEPGNSASLLGELHGPVSKNGFPPPPHQTQAADAHGGDGIAERLVDEEQPSKGPNAVGQLLTVAVRQSACGPIGLTSERDSRLEAQNTTTQNKNS